MPWSNLPHAGIQSPPCAGRVKGRASFRQHCHRQASTSVIPKSGRSSNISARVCQGLASDTQGHLPPIVMPSLPRSLPGSRSSRSGTTPWSQWRPKRKSWQATVPIRAESLIPTGGPKKSRRMIFRASQLARAFRRALMT